MTIRSPYRNKILGGTVLVACIYFNDNERQNKKNYVTAFLQPIKIKQQLSHSAHQHHHPRYMVPRVVTSPAAI